MTFATPDQVAVELGRSTDSITDTERIQWQSWLDRVERAIYRRFKRSGLDLDAQIALGDPTAEDVADVEVAAVARKFRVSEAASKIAPGTSRTRSIDDGSITDRNDSRIDSGYEPLDLLDDEWASLLPSALGGAFSTRPGFEPDRCAPEWLG